MQKLKAIIIDDEMLARQELRFLLGSLQEVEVIGEAENADDAYELAQALRPDLIFLDIEMPGKSGFDFLEMFEEVPNVIFTTAYSEYAIKAFEENAIDYILKPIQLERLQRAVVKVSKLIESNQPTAKTDRLQKEAKIFMKDGNRCYFVSVQNIYFIKSLGNYVRLHFDSRSALLNRSMNHLEMKLPPDMFFRANKSEMVNLEEISEVQLMHKGIIELKLPNNIKVTLSSRQSVKFREIMSV